MTLRRSIGSLVFIGLLVANLLLYRVGDGTVGNSPIAVSLLISTCGAIIHFATNLQKNWMRIDSVFIVSYFVVFFQWPVMSRYFNLIPPYGFQVDALESAEISVSIATIGLISWMAGFNLPIKRPRPIRIVPVRNAKIIPPLFVLLMASFTVAAGSSFLSREVHTVGSENIVNTLTGISSYILDLLEGMARLSLAVLLYSWIAKTRNAPEVGLSAVQTWLNLALVTAYCLLFLIAGERGQVVMILCAAAICYGSAIRPVGFGLFVGTLIGGFFLLSLVAVLRVAIDGVVLFGVNYGYWEISTNLAGSFVTLANAIEIYGSISAPLPGQVFLSQLLGIIPFAQGFVIPELGFRPDEVNSSLMITYHVFGPNARSGLGTSLPADLYLAFGLAGVSIGMFAFGLVARIMQDWIGGGHGFTRFLIAVIFAGLIIYVVRASILFPLKPILWGIAAAALFGMLRHTRREG